MPRFSTNISMMFTEHPFADRFAAARDAGFDKVEMQFPYDDAAEDIAASMEAAGIGFVVFNLPVGDLREGGPGLAAMPGRQAAFDEAIALGLRYAKILKPLNINVLAGWPPVDRFSRDQCLGVLADNLARAAAAFAEIGVRVLTEAVNTRDRPGYLVDSTARAVAVLGRAGHPNLGLEHDIYHMQIMEGDLLETIRAHFDDIRHIQFADTPGRHQPGSGEINFPFLFEALDDLSYPGWLGAEYVPTTGRTIDSLGWLTPYI